jgi:hypothetical protein
MLGCGLLNETSTVTTPLQPDAVVQAACSTIAHQRLALVGQPGWRSVSSPFSEVKNDSAEVYCWIPPL